MNVFDRSINFDALFKFSHISASTQEHLKRVYGSFALCMFVAAAGAYINVVTHLFQFGLLTGLGALGLMVWLTATPHNRETEQKRLGMLVGFAFLTGRWALGLPPTSHETPNPAEGPDEAPQNSSDDTQFCPSRHQSGTSPANVHLHQPQVGDAPTDPVPTSSCHTDPVPSTDAPQVPPKLSDPLLFTPQHHPHCLPGHCLHLCLLLTERPVRPAPQLP
uniref:Transmembrane BAX inhibitor motif containing 6 n=1 Tax=Cyanistes caeruleus TaxID=156563 RepID=A0A8C0U1M3_CYACU